MNNKDLVSVQTEARQSLAALVPLALQTLANLANDADRDSVKLAAAESILDRSGVGKSQNVQVTTTEQEHQIATTAALEVLERLAKNHAALPAPAPAIDVLVVLEGDSDELPTAITEQVVSAIVVESREMLR